eukprot:m.15213 g.15213  ORF g.15213 m.15213 type:complete len:242 (+) comp10487_c0_seq1:278-1003(+)
MNCDAVSPGQNNINLGRTSQRVCLLDAKLSSRNASPEVIDIDEEELATDGPVPTLTLTLHNAINIKHEEVLDAPEEKSFSLQYRGMQQTGKKFPSKGELSPDDFAELTSTLAVQVFNSKFKNASTHPVKCTIGPDFLCAVDLRTADQPIDLHMADILSFKAAPKNTKSKTVKTEALLMSRGTGPVESGNIVCHRLQFKSQADIKAFFLTMRASFENEFKKNLKPKAPTPPSPEEESLDTEC